MGGTAGKLRAVAILMAALTAGGCICRNSLKIETQGSFADTPTGPTAVLRITADPHPPSRSAHVPWGSICTAEPEQDFAARLAHLARCDGGLPVLSADETAQRLDALGFSDTHDPPADALRRSAAQLGLASYLTAHIRRSRLRYVLFWSWAEVDCEVACYLPECERRVWQASIRCRKRFATAGDVTTYALRSAFHALRKDGAERGT